MFKGKLVVLSLIAAALLCWQVMPASVDTANSGIVDPCSSFAYIVGGPYCWLVCPQGDGPPLNNLTGGGDATIYVTAKDQTGNPIPGIPFADFWLIGWQDLLALCGGAGAIDADANSDVNGEATISTAMFAGGCETGIAVVIQGALLLDPANWTDPLCLAITTRSPDINGDLDVQSLDFTVFGNAWGPLGNPYNPCADYNCDGQVQSLDFTQFGNHWQHSCN
jgi:hypothetical protein